MANLLAQGMAFLHAQRDEHMSSEVLFVRGAEEVAINATIGQTVFEETDRYGVVQRERSRDFIVLAADLVIDSQVVTPEKGDMIKETTGATVRTFEVMPFGDNPLWRWSDPHRTAVRIHTKHVRTE